MQKILSYIDPFDNCVIFILMILINNYTLINPRKNNDISLYLGLFEKSPTVLRKAIVTTPYSDLKFKPHKANHNQFSHILVKLEK